MNTRVWTFCALLALFAVPAFAQDYEMELFNPGDGASGGWSGSSSYSQGRYLDNPCTAWQDLVWVDYSSYTAGQQLAAGIDRYLVDESTTVGGMYTARGSARTDVGYDTALAIRNYYKVNTPDDFHVVTVVNFDPASQYLSQTVETACGNGMPDSKE